MFRLISLILLAIIFLNGCAQTTPRKDLGIARIVESLNKLENDSELQGFATETLNRARSSVRKLQSVKDMKERVHLAYIAQVQIELARAKARTQWAKAQEQEYKAEKNQLIVDIKTAEADIARREAERALLQSQASQEETDRMRRQMNRANQQKEEADITAANAISEANQAKRVANAQRREANIARREAEVAKNALADAQNRLRDLEAKQTDRGVVLTLGDVLFAPSETILKDSSLEEIRTLAEFLSEYPNQNVRVEGHTDNKGGTQLNQKISQRRAEAVLDALIGFGVKESRLMAIGFGESRPVAENASQEGRAKNRRVEVVLLDEEK